LISNLVFNLPRPFENHSPPVRNGFRFVGSVKRGDPKALAQGVHDIELLIIPDPAHIAPVFGGGLSQPRNKLERLMVDLKEDHIISSALKKAEGDKYKKFAIVQHSEGQLQDFCLELFIVTARTWAIQNVIRTGPSAFSQRFVTSETAMCFHESSGKTYKGLLPMYYEYVKGETCIRVRNSGDVLDLKEESDAIKLLGLRAGPDHWIPPAERYMYT